VSYSFSVIASTKEGAKQKLAEQFDLVIQNQPCHAADKDAAVAAGSAFIDLLTDVPEGHEIHVGMHGSLGWNQNAPDKFTGAGVGVSAHFRLKTSD